MNRKRLVLSPDVNVRLEGSDVSTGGRGRVESGLPWTPRPFPAKNTEPRPRFLRNSVHGRRSASAPAALRSRSSAHPRDHSAHPLLHVCLLLRGKSTPVSVSHQGEPERPPAEHPREKHPDHGINRSRRNELGCCRRRWPRENRPSGRNNSGKKRTWPPLTTNTITAIARPIASTRINGPPLNERLLCRSRRPGTALKSRS